MTNVWWKSSISDQAGPIGVQKKWEKYNTKIANVTRNQKPATMPITHNPLEYNRIREEFVQFPLSVSLSTVNPSSYVHSNTSPHITADNSHWFFTCIFIAHQIYILNGIQIIIYRFNRWTSMWRGFGFWIIQLWNGEKKSQISENQKIRKS